MRGSYINKDTNESIEVSKVGINKVSSHGEREDAHLKSLSVIPQLIENSIFIEERANAKDNGKYDTYQYYVVGLNIEGVDYTAKVVIGVKGDVKYYDHNLTEIEKGALIDNLNVIAKHVADNQNSLYKDKDSVLLSLLQTNSSKVVDANGEPMVVYHGSSSSDIAEFDKSESTRERSGLKEFDHFFTTNRGVADRYAAIPISYKTAVGIDAIEALAGENTMDGSVKVDGIKMSNVIELSIGTDNPTTLERFFAEFGGDSYQVFDAKNIKSATDNNGEFSGDNGDIRFRQDQEVNEKFNEMQREAVISRGIVAPNLNNTSVNVVQVEKHNFNGDNPIKQAKGWAKENIVGTHTANAGNSEVFEYTISNASVDKMLSGSSVANSDNLGVHLASMVRLPDIINNSIEVEVHPDYNKGSDQTRGVENGYNKNRLIHRLYGAIQLDGKTYRVKTTMLESKDTSIPNKPYSYEVTKIELLEDMNSSNEAQRTNSTNNSRGFSTETTKLLNNVEKSYDKGKKLLDDSETITSDTTPEQLEQQRQHSVSVSQMYGVYT